MAPTVPFTATANTSTGSASPRPRGRFVYTGPRCPQCAGPLVFGEGCSVCPVCGHSSCAL